MPFFHLFYSRKAGLSACLKIISTNISIWLDICSVGHKIAVIKNEESLETGNMDGCLQISGLIQLNRGPNKGVAMVTD